MSDVKTSQPVKLDRSGINRILQILATLLIFGAVLFALAGRLDWWEAWAFLAIFVLAVCVNGLWTLRHNPGLINERGRIAKESKPWDKVLMSLYTLFLLGMVVVAGLDARFGWSEAPQAIKIVGGLVFILAMLLVFWVMTANTFLSTMVRIQTERGHYTVTTGPYRYVRHPMYAGMFFFFWGIPLLLGSWWALIPGVVNVVIFIIRTALEDKTLQAELPGYAEYAQRVRYRLVPGVW